MKWSLMDSRWDYQWLKSIINGTIIDMYDNWWILTIMVMIIGGLLISPLVVTTNHWRVVHWLFLPVGIGFVSLWWWTLRSWPEWVRTKWHVFKAFTTRNLLKVVAYTAIDDIKLITIFRGVATAQLDLALCELRIPCVFTALRCNMLRICPMTLEPRPIQRMPQAPWSSLWTPLHSSSTLGRVSGARPRSCQSKLIWLVSASSVSFVFIHLKSSFWPPNSSHVSCPNADSAIPIYIIISYDSLCSMPMLPES